MRMRPLASIPNLAGPHLVESVAKTLPVLLRRGLIKLNGMILQPGEKVALRVHRRVLGGAVLELNHVRNFSEGKLCAMQSTLFECKIIIN